MVRLKGDWLRLSTHVTKRQRLSKELGRRTFYSSLHRLHQLRFDYSEGLLLLRVSERVDTQFNHL